eukprot:CAMPEP_0203879846 /NCGR_PEP_ID=MMETSP0359-20131031/24275_1 /ASSEMBLY_ACC=CAM_ASM_000338 /TAXON_ID=268821 /ORGANISM="Scrippsiella Hangoei, Strain SHTV-5" /LENGTH=164 /DNA_ID=CAMNT_0050799347 /DNA_START=572 /DNA_END=1066 /DNA_ORIENTATION=+
MRRMVAAKPSANCSSEARGKAPGPSSSHVVSVDAPTDASSSSSAGAGPTDASSGATTAAIAGAAPTCEASTDSCWAATHGVSSWPWLHRGAGGSQAADGCCSPGPWSTLHLMKRAALPMATTTPRVLQWQALTLPHRQAHDRGEAAQRGDRSGITPARPLRTLQ